MNFNKRQIEAINAKDGNFAVLAKAGAGKTAVIVERTNKLIESGVVPKKIVIITFSNEAKDNLLARLPGTDVCIKTFHGLAYGIVRKFNSDIKIWDQSWEKERCITETFKRLGLFSDEIDFSGIYRWMSVQRFNLLEPEDVIETSHTDYDLKILKAVYSDYIEYKTKNNLIEFDDMVYMAIKYLNENKDVLEAYQRVVEYCMVDEFQDTSKDQIELLKLLTGKHHNLMVVGDPTQNIYAFRGSDAKYLTYFDKYFEGGKFINLNINYRSSQEIVEFSNTIAQKDELTNTDNYEKAETPNTSCGVPIITNTNNLIPYMKDYLDKGYEYKDMFILTRTNSELQDFEALLSTNDIPYKTYNNKSFLDNPEIKLVLSYILLGHDLYDNDSFIYLMNRPNRFLKKDTPSLIENRSLYIGLLELADENWKYKKAASDLKYVIGELRSKHFDNVGDMIKFVRNAVDIDEFVAKTQSDTDNRKENLDKFQNTCNNFKTIEQLKMFMTKIRSNNKKDDKNRVHLLTAHKSKGMESKVVFVAGMNEESFPHKNATDIESEYRLFYVACTRAEEHLILVANPYEKISRFITPDLNLINKLQESVGA